MASSQEHDESTTGSSSKAMKLLGLSKLPPEASRAEHLALIQHHRSFRKERAKSASPHGLQRFGALYKAASVSHNTAVFEEELPLDLATPVSSEQEISSRESSGGRNDGAGRLDDSCSGLIPHTERLSARESSSLRLASTDLDDRFIRTITELMAQFPEPPTRVSTMDLHSPATLAVGWGRKGDWRGIHPSKSFNSWRGGGAGDKQHQQQHRQLMHQQIKQQLHQRHQKKMSQQQQQQTEPNRRQRSHRHGSASSERFMREVDVPVIIMYAQEGDSFEL